MKIYEIRDISDDERYYTVKYCSTAFDAIEELKRLKEDVSEYQDDTELVVGAVYEHEVGVFSHQEGFDVKIFEMSYSQEYLEDKDEYIWKGEVTFPKPTSSSGEIAKGEER